MDTDIILLSAAKKMDEESLIRIFDLYATPIYGYALRLCDDPLKADEIVGAVFARFMDQISSGHRPVTHLRICLYKIAYEIIVADAHLDCWTGPAGPVQTTLSAQSIGSSRPANSESRELLEAVLRVVKYDLTEDQRHVLFLRFLEGFTLKETAAIIGKKVGNVRRRAAAGLVGSGVRAMQPRQPQCAAVKLQAPGKGKRCSKPSALGSEFCWVHDPARRVQVVEIVTAMRERLAA